MSNRTTLAQLREMDVTQAACLPIDQLAMLLEEVAGLRADAKRLSDLLTDALHARFGSIAADMRQRGGKQTGRVRITLDGGFEVIADIPKKVEWDQAKLREAEAAVRSWGEDPAQYLTAVLSVPESRYNAWPESIRKVFEPARTLGAGKPTYAIEQKDTH